MKRLLLSLLIALNITGITSFVYAYGEETTENEETEIADDTEQKQEEVIPVTTHTIHVTDGICELNEAETGQEITIHCLNKPMYHFDGWFDEEGQSLSNDDSYVFTMPDYDVSIVGKYSFVQGWYDNKYFLDENTYAKEQWLTIDSQQYYFDGNGDFVKSKWQDGHYLSKDGSMLVNGWLTDNNKKYYFDQNGNKATGINSINGQKFIFDSNGVLKTGWIFYNKQWYYADENGVVKTGWLMNNGKWYYLKSDGIMVTGWQKVNNVWYYLNSSGAMQTGWLKMGNTWYYLKSSGAMATGWQKINNKWYYLNKSGSMATGWKQVSSKWYYLDPTNGDMKTGWWKVNNVWYYLNNSGAMQTGWLKSGNTWYYLKSSGAMATGWQKVNNVWYYLNSSGAMQTGWLKSGNTWYYLKSSGAMMTGWQKVNGTMYYFLDSGAMVTGTIKIGKINYHFNGNGAFYSLFLTDVPYYSQNDSRWANYRLGNYNAMRSTGCTPSVAASIVDYLSGSSYTPKDLAQLFYGWGDYNKDYGHGTASTCWRKLANCYGLTFQNNMSCQDLIDALKEGKLCAAAMGDGYFAGPSYTHSICFFGIDASNRTYVYDPLNSRKNGWYSVRDIYNQGASLWLDNLDGGPFYAFSK